MKEILNIYVDIYNEKTSARSLSVIKMNMNSKEHKTYEIKTKNKFEDYHKIEVF